VNGELAEAVADVLARSAPNGVTTEQAVDFVNDEDEGTPTGPITVRAYLPADERLEETRQRLEEGLYFLGMIQPLPAAVFTPIADQNWMEAWKERYHPIPIGKKLIIVPAWLESPDAGRVSIKIDPGMAFGTGTHPSTQLCLELIEDICDQIPSAERASQAAIDVGCGSGILSIGALKLGMGFALGVDIDEASVRASRENADTNAIAPERFAIGLGSVTEILEGKFQVKQARLVLANILAPVIIRLFGMGLADLVAADGALVLAGILTDQAESVQTCAEQHGLRFVQKRQMGDWVALMFAH
jgi:ribosomal protein L11 methyltransferase